MNTLRTRLRQDRGMTLVFVGLSMLALMSAAMLALDVGNLMVARTQAQSAADAGALAGAVGLLKDWNNRTASGQAVQSAVVTATSSRNAVVRSAVSVIPADVTFPAVDRVHVTVYRTAARGNPVSTFLGSMVGISTVDVGATATARVAPANAMTCVKPFMIPDKWREVGTPPWDAGDTYDAYTSKGVPLANPDVYVPADQTGYTGYTTQNDAGQELVLRAGTGDEINPSFYYSWKMPDDVGGDFYRENIANCNQSIMRWKDIIIQEPGDKTGPTIQGIEELIAKDPAAVWDTSCVCVKNSAYAGVSPRVFPIPLYDPEYYANGKANGRVADFRIANFLGFFADHVSGNKIYGRITQIVGLVDRTAGPAPDNLMPKAIQLVE
jgi:Putative Flp pilus-assembly TadE/G-like